MNNTCKFCVKLCNSQTVYSANVIIVRHQNKWPNKELVDKYRQQTVDYSKKTRDNAMAWYADLQYKWPNKELVDKYRQQTVDYSKKTIDNAMAWYADFTRLSDVRRAQDRVMLASDKMRLAQEAGREAQKKLPDIQNDIRKIVQELRNTERHDDRYLELVSQEHTLVKQSKLLQDKADHADREERFAFEQLSSALRESHEIERLRAETTKYYTLIGSLAGTMIGIIGSYVINRMKMKEIQAMVNGNPNIGVADILYQIKGEQKILHAIAEQNKKDKIERREIATMCHQIQNQLSDLQKIVSREQKIVSRNQNIVLSEQKVVSEGDNSIGFVTWAVSGLLTLIAVKCIFG